MQDFSTSWDIKATPTFFFLKNGQQIDKLVGANKPELQKKITAILDSAANSGQWQFMVVPASQLTLPGEHFVVLWVLVGCM